MTSAGATPRPPKADPRVGTLRGDSGLRTAIDDIANQLCQSVDGNFGFAVRAPYEDETLEKLSMLVNFVVDTARRGMSALEERNAALAEIDQAKTVFFSNASHELRTPLTLILGPLEDALSRPEGALSGETLALAHRNAVRLLKLVNALLDFARIEGGRLQPHVQPTDIAELTTQLAAVFAVAVEKAGLTLTVDAPPGGDPVDVDRDMWEKIVLNLLSNAFKFTLDGGITLRLHREGGHVVLVVSDTGVGIDAALLPRVFERFFRVPGSGGRTHEGFGIGLAMIQELVRLHGGTIEAASEPGRGSTFTVRLPVRHGQAGPERRSERRAGTLAHAFGQEAAGWLPEAASTRPAAAGPAERARVLLADDNADMRAYVDGLLSEHWTVESFADGKALLAAARRQPPDLVLTDIMMPVLDGFGLLRELRADDRTRDVPVILLSARSGPEAVAEGLESGADDYLIKPFAARELVARVRTHLELSRLRMDRSIIQRVGTLLNTHLDLPGVVQTLTDEATRLCGADFGAFFYNVVDEAGERYTLYTLAGVPRSHFEKFPLPRNTAQFDETFSGRGVVRLDDVTKDPRYGLSAPYHGMPPGHLPVRSYLAVPVISRTGAVLGGLFFGHGETGVFTERSERLLGAVATQAAIAIDNAHLYESEQRARAQAESANRAKDEFLAMLGHELRNPLAPIVTALDVMEMQATSADGAERAVIRRQVDHLGRLVDDLLDVSRITRGLVELERRPVELSRVVAKALEISGPVVRDRGHRVELTLPERGLVVHGDLMRLGQVAANLLTNAAKYSERNSRISVSGVREGADVVLRVRDNGIGIPADMLPRIFERFVQGPQSLDRSQGGLGLGLAIVRSLVAQHGGSVTASSEGAGRGSEFEVRLPAYAGAETPQAQTPGPLVAAGVKASGRCRILIVDDNADAGHMLGVALELAGHATRVITDGRAALAASVEFRPDVVLLDLGLPFMDGYEVARALRRDGPSPLRIVAVTGYGEDSARQRTTDAGFDQHLLKPVDVGGLTALLGTWFGGEALRQP
ncbi:MAG TPA: ATP-binding protein [Verrucomicrobiae bacterium]|nr:ATP-binding protein [Verrucomicrobiae bacterium]